MLKFCGSKGCCSTFTYRKLGWVEVEVLEQLFLLGNGHRFFGSRYLRACFWKRQTRSGKMDVQFFFCVSDGTPMMERSRFNLFNTQHACFVNSGFVPPWKTHPPCRISPLEAKKPRYWPPLCSRTSGGVRFSVNGQRRISYISLLLGWIFPIPICLYGCFQK